MTSTTDAGGFTLRRAELGDFEGMCRLVSQLTVLDGPRGPPTRDDQREAGYGARAPHPRRRDSRHGYYRDRVAHRRAQARGAAGASATSRTW